MKRKLLSLLVLIMTAVSGAWADVVPSGTCGDPNVNSGTDVSWTLTDAGVLTISGTGAMKDYADYDNTPWYSKKGDITSIVIGSGVTSIGDNAFGECTNLASVSIPASVTRLGDHAFEYCGTNAATLTVTFAEGTSPMTIGEYAFKKANLTSITIPNRVTSIGKSAFNNCTNLASVSIPASVTSLGEEAFSKSGTNAAALTVTFAEGTSPMTIGLAAFAKSNLTSITIPNRVTSIGNYAFHLCTNLASVYVMASTPPALGEFAFDGNASGRKIYVPASSVGDASTDGTYKHNWSAYADDIEAFPVTATGDCGTNCTYTLYGNGLLTISGTGAMADYTTSDGTPWNSNRNDITSVVIESGVTSIANNAFSGCPNLATITLNSNPTIGEDAFENIKDGATVTMNLTANSGDGAYWMTFYNENYSFTADTNTKIYKAKVNGTTTAVVLTAVDDIPAGNAAVLKSSNEVVTMTLASSTSGDYTGNELKGAASATVVAAGDNVYCLSNETTREGGQPPRGVGFYTYTGTIPVNRAYLEVTDDPTTSRGFLGFGDDDDATAIDNGKWKIDNSDGTIYDLSGRIVTGQPRKGIYVKNGKLVVIK